jgi:hypothetical protein
MVKPEKILPKNFLNKKTWLNLPKFIFNFFFFFHFLHSSSHCWFEIFFIPLMYVSISWLTFGPVLGKWESFKDFRSDLMLCKRRCRLEEEMRMVFRFQLDKYEENVVIFGRLNNIHPSQFQSSLLLHRNSLSSFVGHCRSLCFHIHVGESISKRDEY